MLNILVCLDMFLSVLRGNMYSLSYQWRNVFHSRYLSFVSREKDRCKDNDFAYQRRRNLEQVIEKLILTPVQLGRLGYSTK